MIEARRFDQKRSCSSSGGGRRAIPFAPPRQGADGSNEAAFPATSTSARGRVGKRGPGRRGWWPLEQEAATPHHHVAWDTDALELADDDGQPVSALFGIGKTQVLGVDVVAHEEVCGASYEMGNDPDAGHPLPPLPDGCMARNEAGLAQERQRVVHRTDDPRYLSVSASHQQTAGRPENGHIKEPLIKRIARINLPYGRLPCNSRGIDDERALSCSVLASLAGVVQGHHRERDLPQSAGCRPSICRPAWPSGLLTPLASESNAPVTPAARSLSRQLGFGPVTQGDNRSEIPCEKLNRSRR